MRPDQMRHLLARAFKKRPRHACAYLNRMTVPLTLSPAVP